MGFDASFARCWVREFELSGQIFRRRDEEYSQRNKPQLLLGLPFLSISHLSPTLIPSDYCKDLSRST